ncbi:MAG: hypothetical protein ACLQPH_17100 [Acidimicrobiales bacterium]
MSHSVGRPWPGLVPYASSKAALDELVLGLRSEEPCLRTVRVVVGPTATPFADGWDPEVAGPLFERWAPTATSATSCSSRTRSPTVSSTLWTYPRPTTYGWSAARNRVERRRI